MDGKVEVGVMKEGLEAGLRRAQRWELCAWKVRACVSRSALWRDLASDASR